MMYVMSDNGDVLWLPEKEHRSGNQIGNKSLLDFPRRHCTSIVHVWRSYDSTPASQYTQDSGLGVWCHHKTKLKITLRKWKYGCHTNPSGLSYIIMAYTRDFIYNPNNYNCIY